MKMSPYPAYKSSGVASLGDIPAHWDVKRLKFIAPASAFKLSDKPDDLPYVGLENIESGTGRLLMETQPETVESNVGIFEKGDILFGKLRPYLAKVAQADFQGSCTTEILALHPQRIDGRFLLYSLLSPTFIETVNAMTYGTKMPRASWEQIGNLSLSLPPLPEQHFVAAYLDRETARLDTLIAKKERLIELLQEKRTAIISHAVTSGNSRNKEQKDNGPAPWLFSLPIRWKRQELKYNSYMKGRIGYENLRSEEYTDEGPYLVSSVHFKDGMIEWDKCNHVTRERFEMAPEIILQAHDVLFMKDGALMGKLAYVDDLPGEACLNSHLLLVRPLRGSYLPRFLFYLLMSDVFNAYMEEERKGTTFFGFSQESMGNFPIGLPPISEQIEICNYIDRKTKQLDDLATTITAAIERLHEYRTALISAAVTGKIDVRKQLEENTHKEPIV